MLHSASMSTARKIDKSRGDRIRTVRTDVLGLRSQELFAEKLSSDTKDLTRGAVGNWELGKEVGLENLTAICRISGVSLDWLAYGRGPMFANEKKPLAPSFDPDAPDTSDPDWEAGDRMAAYFNGGLHYNGTVRGASPEIPAAAGAGQGHVLEDRGVAVKSGGIATGHPVLNEWVIPPDFVRHGLNATPSQIVLIPVVGHSMEPRLYAGDRVLVDLSQSAYAGDAIYVIDDGDEVLKVKTLAKIAGSAPPRFRIISEAAPDRFDELAHDQFRIIGRAVGRFSRM